MDSIREKDKAEGACGGENRALERECAASWVSLAGDLFYFFGCLVFFGGLDKGEGGRGLECCEKRRDFGMVIVGVNKLILGVWAGYVF